jgi:hypothetical protein
MEIDIGIQMIVIGVICLVVRAWSVRYEARTKKPTAIDDKTQIIGLLIIGWTGITMGVLRLLFV